MAPQNGPIMKELSHEKWAHSDWAPIMNDKYTGINN